MSNTLSIRDYAARAYTVGATGSSDSGKPTLLLALCRLLRDSYSIAVVTTPPSSGQDGSREFLLRHKALARSRVVAAGEASGIEPAVEWLMTEARPELIFVDGGMGEPGTAALIDFTIHVVNGSRAQMSEEDAAGAARSDLLVLNKTHVGAPLDPERHVAVRESIRIRGAAPYVVADLRYGMGTFEIARQFLASWRQTNAPAAWAEPLDAHVVLTPAWHEAAAGRQAPRRVATRS